jgi:CBS domain-containing protein
MTQPVVTASPETDIGEVAEKMIDNDVHSVPIVEDSFVVGIISRGDALRTMIRSDDVLTAEVQHRLDEYSGGNRRWTAMVSDGAVTVDGQFDNDIEQDVVTILARTVPGIQSAAHATEAGTPTVATE